MDALLDRNGGRADSGIWLKGRFPDYPFVEKALNDRLRTLRTEEQTDLLCLFQGLDCHDLPSVEIETMLGYVRASQKAKAMLPYTRAIPREVYERYVLAPRVNNEWLDGSREWLMGQLLPRVQGKTLLDAALEVNYWCSEEAAYLPTDDRTIAPLGMCNRTQGRCGEESTLLVCALRAVGIPARQCYAPYWAHCDDNHAWVEFWTEDGWRFLGACEPEWKADQGWFLSAASKAMLIRSREGSIRGCRQVNTTGMYAQTVTLTVYVRTAGEPVAGTEVRFQLINYSRLQTLCVAVTDEKGCAAMETGLGTLLVSACMEGVLTERLVDLREERHILLEKEDGFCPEREERCSRWSLKPPKEIIPAPPPKSDTHRQRLRRCDELRNARRAAFSAAAGWLKKAGGNAVEIQKFLALPQFSMEDKEALLETLRDKDFYDASASTLESFLTAALPYREAYPYDVWQKQILAPRVEWEMLLPVRHELQSLLRGYPLTTKEAVLSWMEENLVRDEEYGLTDRRGNGAGYVRNGHCPASEWHILAVQICRALGIPAALCPKTGRLKTLTREIPLTLKTEGPVLNEEEHYSISRWDGRDYVPIRTGCGVNREQILSLEPGAYSLIVTRRQIDGTVDANAQRFLLDEPRTLWLRQEPDETEAKLGCCPLPPVPTQALTENAGQVADLSREQPSALIFLEPGGEPTEHLLQELLEMQAQYREAAYPIRFLIAEKAALENATLQRVLTALPLSAVSLYREELRFPVQAAARIGDGRLPLTLVLDRQGNAAYGCANYNIRTAAKLYNILRILQDWK